MVALSRSVLVELRAFIQIQEQYVIIFCYWCNTCWTFTAHWNITSNIIPLFLFFRIWYVVVTNSFPSFQRREILVFLEGFISLWRRRKVWSIVPEIQIQRKSIWQKKRRKMQKWKTYMRAVLSEQKKKTKKKKRVILLYVRYVCFHDILGVFKPLKERGKFHYPRTQDTNFSKTQTNSTVSFSSSERSL